MKSHPLFSQKDLQVLKATYRIVLDSYYDNPTEDKKCQILLLNNLTLQTISTRQQSDELLLISILQILKLKAKSSKDLLESVQSTIAHLKNPTKIPLQNQTLEDGLQKMNLYQICCVILSRFYEHEMKHKNDTYDWKNIIIKVSKNCDKNMRVALEATLMLLSDFIVYGKEVNKSGMVKFIFSVYLPQFLTEKINLFRSLKLLKLVATNDKSVLLGRQKSMSLIIYNYPEYIMMIQSIEQLCFDREYCLKILKNPKDIDPIFTWSFCSKFCQLCPQQTIYELQNLLAEGGKDTPVQLEFKVYQTINSVVKVKDVQIRGLWKISVSDDRNHNSYLKLMNSVIQKNPGEHFKKFDIRANDAIYNQSKTTNPITDKLFRDLKNLDPSNVRKVGKLAASNIHQFSIDKNPDILMQGVSKIPENNQELQVIEKVLNECSRNFDQFQLDTINSLKSRAIESLKKAIIRGHKIDLSLIFNNLSQQSYDLEIINKLLKLGELYLTKDPELVSKFNTKKFIGILDWLERNQDISVIDWVAAGQMLSIIFGSEEWKQHIEEIPERNFWLINGCDSDLNDRILSQVNSVPLNHPKLPLILGFISKSDNQAMKKMILKSKLVQHIINEVCNHKNSKAQNNASDYSKIKEYFINVLNLSAFIFQWSGTENSQEIKSKIIAPCLENILKCFQGSEHEFRFLENSLPFEINIMKLKDVNVSKLLQTHGRLASYFYNSKYQAKIDFSRISTVSSENDPCRLEEILKFIEQNSKMIEVKDLFSLMMSLIRKSKIDDEKYWQYFPNYMSILEHIISISTKSPNHQVMAKLTDILLMMIGGTAQNQNIMIQQFEQLYETIYDGLGRILQREIRIDVNSLKLEAEKVKDEEWKSKIIERLKGIDEMISKLPICQTGTEVQIQKIAQIPKKQIKSEESQAFSQNKAHHSKKEHNIFNEQKFNDKPSISESVTDSVIPFETFQVGQIKKDQNILQGQIDMNEFLQNQEFNKSSQNPQDQKLFSAFKKLKMIIKKQEPKQTFPELLQIFKESDFNRNRRYILGHLLTEYYEAVQKDARIIEFLQMRDKTNLSREVCYQFLKKFEQVIVIGKRWKLVGSQFLDLAMSRVQSTNENKEICIENGCEIAQYNIPQNDDLCYFQNQKYHEIIKLLMERISTCKQAYYYFLLFGSSSRLTSVKAYYIANKLHLNLISFANQQQFLKDPKFIANLSYAISSLVYTQNQVSVEVSSRKSEMLALLNAYRKFSKNKSVIEAGCSMLSNVCYSNKESRQILYSYQIVQVLVEIAKSNLDEPQAQTFKQMMRTFGNISLHKGCAYKLIDSHVCTIAITMVEKFNILIYRDEEKMKVLKFTVDFISNLATQKYNLQLMHEQGLTDFIITILQTIEISEDQILMACVDTIDGLCQSNMIENYVVMDKKLLMQLIDLLKVKQDQKLITKCIRLLTNMTLNQMCIPYILQANLLAVLANIVLPIFSNEKINIYINKIIVRIFLRKPDVKLVLKSGYLDCLMKAMQMNELIDDSYIDIMLHYCQYIPNYLNHRAFFNLVKLLTTQQNHQDIIEKCLKILRIIFSSEERYQQDIPIKGSSSMYEKLLLNNQNFKTDILFLIGLHCTKSKNFKDQLYAQITSAKEDGIINAIKNIPLADQNTKLLGESIMFSILNRERTLLNVSDDIVQQQDSAFQLLTKGFHCKLYRIDGSYKSAFLDMNEMYSIRAYKYPQGQIKKKYVIGVRHLRDWQFFYESNNYAWKSSVFNKERGLFSEKPKINNCLTLLGSQQWGYFTFLNIEFLDVESKISYIKAISALVKSFKC